MNETQTITFNAFLHVYGQDPVNGINQKISGCEHLRYELAFRFLEREMDLRTAFKEKYAERADISEIRRIFRTALEMYDENLSSDLKPNSMIDIKYLSQCPSLWYHKAMFKPDNNSDCDVTGDVKDYTRQLMEWETVLMGELCYLYITEQDSPTICSFPIVLRWSNDVTNTTYILASDCTLYFLANTNKITRKY